MSYSLKMKGTLLGCVIGFGVSVRLAFVGTVGLFGSMYGVADYANELSLLIAVLTVYRCTERLQSCFENRARRRVLEEGFVKWASEVETRRATKAVNSPLKIAA